MHAPDILCSVFERKVIASWGKAVGVGGACVCGRGMCGWEVRVCLCMWVHYSINYKCRGVDASVAKGMYSEPVHDVKYCF